PGGAQRRRQSEDERREQGNSQRKSQDSRVGRKIQGHWIGSVGGHQNKQATASPGQRDSGETAQAGEQEAFRERLADEARACGAHRQPYSKFFLPYRRARQQQVGHVGASDQQDGADDGHQDF